MNIKYSLIILLPCFIFFGNKTVFAQTEATAILKKMDDVMFAIDDKTMTVKMVMLNLKSQKEKIKEGVLMQKGANTKLFRYTAPESDAGIATLSLPSKEVYLYLPMFKKPKKITNLAESNAFNKSDFSFEDMAPLPYSEQYTSELLTSDGSNYTLDLFPLDEKENGHIVAHINKEHYYPEQFDFYDKKNELVKKSLYKHVKVNGFWVADVLSMEDMKKDHKTTLYMTDIKLNQGLDDELFALENLVPKEEEADKQ